MEIINLAGVAILVILVVIILIWQKRLWDASDANRYYSKHPPDYISFEVMSPEVLSNYEWHTLSEFVYATLDAMGLEAGGSGDNEHESFIIEGMTHEQAEALEKVVTLFIYAAGFTMRVTAWEHHNVDEEEE